MGPGSAVDERRLRPPDLDLGCDPETAEAGVALAALSPTVLVADLAGWVGWRPLVSPAKPANHSSSLMTLIDVRRTGSLPRETDETRTEVCR